MQTLTSTLPDDFHIHLRDDAYMTTTVPHCASYCERAHTLDKIEGFCSHFRAQFNQQPINQATITLQQQPWRVPSHYEGGKSQVVPFCANQTLKRADYQ